MLQNTLSFPSVGEYKIGGYAKTLIDYTVDKQLLDADTWKLFVDQFRNHTESGDIAWRGEFWGKMMRGASLTYIATKNEKLYKVLVETVNDIISTQEKSGRISTFKVEDEFRGWDMWSRKYVMLGSLYFYDICKSASLKKKIVKSLKKQADYIIKHIGNGRGKKSIFDTSVWWGAINSCSILEPMVKLYTLTGEQKYFDFCTYLVNSGFNKDLNFIDIFHDKKCFPYQLEVNKAYEMMSCLEGLLEYYKHTKNEYYLDTVKNYIDLVLESDYTIIGCSGCLHELFDNSSITQTEPAKEVVMQETCVTVTFMKLCAKMLAYTGDVKYANVIEMSGYNALFGAVNNENQDMHRSEGTDYNENGPYLVPHEPFPFDSYSPLFQDRRGKRVGGFRPMENGRSYGCCACIGSAGTAIFGLFGVMKSKDGVVINLYNDGRFNGEINGKKTSIVVRANLYKKSGAKISVNSNGSKFTLALRVPTWAENFEVLFNGKKVDSNPVDGYILINSQFNKDKIEVKFAMPVVMHLLNNKIAFTRGPITLARDCRFEDITKPVAISVKNGKTVRAKAIKNTKFSSNETLEIATKNGGKITLCDYSQAGKNYDDDNCNITVWQEIVK